MNRNTIFPLLLLLFLACTNTPDLLTGGTTTETTNGVTARLILPDGTPAANFEVNLVPKAFVPGISSPTSCARYQVRTDSTGTIRFSKVLPDSYALSAISKDSALGLFVPAVVTGKPILAKGDSIVDLGSNMLDSTGTIAGIYQNSDSTSETTLEIGLAGTLYSKDNGFDTLFEMKGIPKGAYTAHIRIPNGSVIKRTGITVLPRETTFIPNLNAVDSLSFYGRKRFIIPALTALGISGDVSQFPLLVRLNSQNKEDSIIFAHTRDPKMLRFLDSAGTATIPFEIERWDSASNPKTAEIWVKVPFIYSQIQTRYLTLLYGAAQATTPANDTVFPSGEGWNAVWHCSEQQGNRLYDATGNGHAAVLPVNTSPVTGVIGVGQNLAGGNWSYDLGTDQNYIAGTNGITLSVWINPGTGGGTILDLGSANDSSRITLSIGANGKPVCAIRQKDLDSTMRILEAPDTITPGTWHQLVATADALVDSLRIFVDGDEKAAMFIDFGASSFAIPHSHKSYLGSRRGTADFFSGMFDECRIYQDPRNNDWIKLSYLSERNSGSLFIAP